MLTALIYTVLCYGAPANDVCAALPCAWEAPLLTMWEIVGSAHAGAEQPQLNVMREGMVLFTWCSHG